MAQEENNNNGTIGLIALILGISLVIGYMSKNAWTAYQKKKKAAADIKAGIKGSQPTNNIPGTSGYDASKPTLNDDDLKRLCDKIDQSVGTFSWFDSTTDVESAFSELKNDADLKALIAKFGMAKQGIRGCPAAGVNLPDFMAQFYNSDLDKINAALKTQGLTTTI